MWLYQCWSSLDLKLFTVGADIILSGNEFQLFIIIFKENRSLNTVKVQISGNVRQ